MNEWSETVAPEGKHLKICKILDFILAAFIVVYFVFNLVPYYDYEAGHQFVIDNGFKFVSSKDANGKEVETKVYLDETVTVTAGEADSFSLLGYCGFPEEHPIIKSIYNNAYGYKIVSIRQLGMVLGMIVAGLLGIFFLLAKKGVVRPAYCLIWSVVGILGFTMNNLLLLGTTYVKYALLAVCIVTAVVSLIDFILYAIDTKAKGDYLKSKSAAYK